MKSLDFKKIILLVFVVLISYSNGISQSIFPESDAIWSYHRYRNNSYDEEWLYGLSGDTIINGVTYNKLYALNDTTLQIDENDIYVGGFRQEDKKLWFRPGTYEYGRLDRELLIFDFGKNIGEVILYDYQFFQSIFWPDMRDSHIEERNSSWEITDIQDSFWGRLFFVGEQYIIVGEQYITGGGQYIVEGVGCLHGMLGGYFLALSCCPTYSFKLACLKHKNEIKYLDEGCKTCFKTGSAAVVNHSLNNISVYTNRDESSIEIEAGSSDLPFTFELIDITGRVLMQVPVDTEYSSISYVKQNGVSLYRIRNNDVVMKTGKLMTLNN